MVRELRVSVWVVLAVALAGLFAPMLANDRPILARIGGRIAAPALAGLRGGLIDLAIVRLVDVVACFPPFILALAFVAASGRTGIGPMVAGIALSRWTSVARYVRGEILRHRGGQIWASARAAGAGGVRLVVRHLLPLMAAPLAVMASFGVASAIVMESSLSF